MAAPSSTSLLVGRSRRADIVLSDESVSGKHVRIGWHGDELFLEDLGSANGTWVRGVRVERAIVSPGEAVLLGKAPLPWSAPPMRRFLAAHAGLVARARREGGRRFVCGACGTRGVLASAVVDDELVCSGCGARLTLGKPTQTSRPAAAVALVLCAAAVTVIAWAWPGQSPDGPVRRIAHELGLPEDPLGAALASTPEESAIRARLAGRVADALDVTHPVTRNTSAQLAAEDQGPFHLEQVMRIWSHVRERWRYVNDPRGHEYFARASETITNAFIGDCDDFATVIAAMVLAIGGDARIVVMGGPHGGHAYAEVCVQDAPSQVASKLAAYYRGAGGRYTQGVAIRSMAFRTSATCPVWLNLDWNARVPGGAYDEETWAVAVDQDGRTESLAPAAAPAASRRASR